MCDTESNISAFKMKIHKQKSSRNRLGSRKNFAARGLIIFILLFGALGAFWLLRSRAAVTIPETNRGAAYDRLGFYPKHVNHDGITNHQGNISNWLGRNQPIPFFLQFA